MNKLAFFLSPLIILLCLYSSGKKGDHNKGVIYKPAIKKESEVHAWGPTIPSSVQGKTWKNIALNLTQHASMDTWSVNQVFRGNFWYTQGPLVGCSPHSVLRPQLSPVWSAEGRNLTQEVAVLPLCFLRLLNAMDSGVTWNFLMQAMKARKQEEFPEHIKPSLGEPLEILLLSQLSKENVHSMLGGCFWNLVSFLVEGIVITLSFLSAMMISLLWLKLLSGQGLLWPESFCRAGRTALLRVMVTEKKTRATLWLVLEIFPKSHPLDEMHQTQLQEWMQHSWISIWNHMVIVSYLLEAQTILRPSQHWWGSYIVF